MLRRIYHYAVYRLRILIGEEKYFLLQLRKNRILQARILWKIRKKEKINVVFFLINESVWKYDQLFQLFQTDSRFNPTILICPNISFGEESMLNDMGKAYNFANKKGYQTIKSLKENGNWVDVNKELEPDIIFFSNPHDITKSEYYIHNFKDKLTCYVPYSFQVSDLYEMQFNQDFHNLTWKNFYETEIQRKIAIVYARNKAKNVVITGYPGCDHLISTKYKPEKKWKSETAKKIIWAPHHTILDTDSDLPYSNFLKYCHTMINLAEASTNNIQIAFKPHPILWHKLSQDSIWGKKKTEDYYRRWQNAEYGMIEDGDYIDLFLTSDAIIHDSGSFVAEYLHVNKPAYFCVKSEETLNHFNEFGKLALSNYYLIYNEVDLLKIINENILKESDPMQIERTQFINEYLVLKDGLTASENIYNYIKSMLK